MKIKNYTTSVSAERTISEIEKLLTDFGASSIIKNFSGDGKVRALIFKFQENGYNIPINIEGVQKVMFEGKKVMYGINAEKNRFEQAYRVSWRITRDWLHAQLSIIISGQAQPEEVLLPYMWDGERTLYQAYKDGKLQIEGDKNR